MERDPALHRDAMMLPPGLEMAPSFLREPDPELENEFNMQTLFWMVVVMLALQYAVAEDPPTLQDVFDLLVGAFQPEVYVGGVTMRPIVVHGPTSPLQGPITLLTMFYTAFVANSVYFAVQPRGGRALAIACVLMIAIVFSYTVL